MCLYNISNNFQALAVTTTLFYWVIDKAWPKTHILLELLHIIFVLSSFILQNINNFPGTTFPNVLESFDPFQNILQNSDFFFKPYLIKVWNWNIFPTIEKFSNYNRNNLLVTLCEVTPPKIAKPPTRRVRYRFPRIERPGGTSCSGRDDATPARNALSDDTECKNPVVQTVPWKLRQLPDKRSRTSAIIFEFSLIAIMAVFVK